MMAASALLKAIEMRGQVGSGGVAGAEDLGRQGDKGRADDHISLRRLTGRRCSLSAETAAASASTATMSYIRAQQEANWNANPTDMNSTAQYRVPAILGPFLYMPVLIVWCVDARHRYWNAGS